MTEEGIKKVMSGTRFLTPDGIFQFVGREKNGFCAKEKKGEKQTDHQPNERGGCCHKG
jgi:hypothetical protein